MKRLMLAVPLSLLFVGIPSYGETATAPAAVTAAADVKVLQKQQAERKAKLRDAADLAGERKAVSEARKAYEEKLAGDPALVQAREAEKSARAKLENVITAKVAASPAQAELDKLRESDAAAADVRFRLKLIALQLEDENSPVMQAVEADPEIKALAGQLRSAEKALAEQPSEQVLAARKALEAAREAQAARAPELAAASKAVAEADAAVAQARAREPKAGAVKAAREALAAARAKALAAVPQAKPLLEEASKLQTQLAEIEKKRQVHAEVIDIYGELVSGDSEVAAARKAVDDARKAREAAIAAAGLSDLQGRLGAAQKARDEKADAAASKDAAYTSAKETLKTLTATIDALQAKGAKLSDAEVRQLAEARVQADSLDKQIYNTRRAAWRAAEVQPLYEAAHALYIEFGNKSHGTAALAATGTARQAADKAYAAAIRAKGMAVKAAQPSVEQLAQLDAQRRSTAHSLAVATLKLHDRDSSVSRAVDATPEVASAAKALAEAEKDMQANPTPAVAAAVSAQNQAEAALKAARGKSEAYAKAAAAHAAAEKALKDASGADPRKAAADKALADLKAARSAKAAKAPGAAALLDERKSIAEQHEAKMKASKDLATKRAEYAKTLANSDDAEIKAVRAAVSEAQKKQKDLIEGAEFAAARKKISDAEAALEAKHKTVVAADGEVQALQRQIDEAKNQAKPQKPAKEEKKSSAASKPAEKAASTRKANGAN